jgi:hypothetical protein
MFNQINYPSRSDYAAICQRPALEQGQLDALISDVFFCIISMDVYYSYDG